MSAFSHNTSQTRKLGGGGIQLWSCVPIAAFKGAAGSRNSVGENVNPPNAVDIFPVLQSLGQVRRPT